MVESPPEPAVKYALGFCFKFVVGNSLGRFFFFTANSGYNLFLQRNKFLIGLVSKFHRCRNYIFGYLFGAGFYHYYGFFG